MTVTENNTLGSIVANNLSTSKVFNKYGLDYCCGGNKTLHDVCKEKNINIKEIINELTDNSVITPGIDYNSWPLDLLIDYIEKKHHRYVREEVPVISKNLDRLCKVHGEKHPELYEVQRHFESSANELSTHMQKEEMLLFPHIRNLVKAKTDNTQIVPAPFGSVKNPIGMMMKEHESEGERFVRIKHITNDYLVPEDGCNTYSATYQMLRDFETDLHLHIHLENNILFPKSIALEAEQ
ncbi:MAG: iron-sulfur cluster repair di-iron protein [Flavipsychrobacter sp.]